MDKLYIDIDGNLSTINLSSSNLSKINRICSHFHLCTNLDPCETGRSHSCTGSHYFCDKIHREIICLQAEIPVILINNPAIHTIIKYK